jgi:hypothetical protein
MAIVTLSEIATLLLDNTKTGAIRWEKTPVKGEFQAPFSRYAIKIRGNSDAPSLYLYDQDGDIVEDYSAMAAVNEGRLNILRELYELARRRALGADEALDEIAKILLSSSGGKK